MTVAQPAEIFLANLPSGVYILKLKTEYTTVVKRIIKE